VRNTMAVCLRTDTLCVT